MALIKLLLLIVFIFAIGTLPWQQHFVGIIGGILCGTALTITMVPFLSITAKYGRKAKVWAALNSFELPARYFKRPLNGMQISFILF